MNVPAKRSESARLHEYTVNETGEVIHLVDRVCARVHKFTAPRGLYDLKRASNAVGRFYEWYVAYLLGANKIISSPSSIPDVQLRDPDHLEKTLLFEVKAGHKNNSTILKRQQLENFSQISNCLFAFVFHEISDIQARWSESKSSKIRVRRELAEFSSLFILPPQLLLEYFLNNIDRAHDMPHYESGETYIELSEPQTRRIFHNYSWSTPKVSHEKIHIISDALSINPNQNYPSSIIRI